MDKEIVSDPALSRVLIVDDEESIRESLEIILTEAGYDVAIAPDGRTAVALAHASDFDVAVVDRILLNSMDGVQVIREIKQYRPLCETILMSAYPSFESAARILEHETFAYLTKPIQQDEIIRVVENAARKSRTRREHQRAELVFKDVFDASPNPIIVYSPRLNIQFVNPAFTRLLGYGREQVLGRGFLFVPDEDLPRVMAEFNSLLEGRQSEEREQIMLSSSGVQICTSRIVSLCTCRRGNDSDILVIIRDISEDKKMQAQIAQAEKLAMLGELAAKLAHEINNPLQIISGHVELLLRKAEAGDIERQLSLIVSAVHKIEKLTSSLLCVARPKPMRITDFAPEQPLEKAADFLLSMGQTKYLCVERDYICNGELVQGDEYLLEQVFMNLIANAAHALADAPQQVIRLQTRADHRRGLAHISVADTGRGIDIGLQDRIFEPFFTTREKHNGNGLGLSVVKQIVERHGGFISVVSEPGQGSTFTVSLPFKQGQSHQACPDAPVSAQQDDAPVTESAVSCCQHAPGEERDDYRTEP